VPDVSISFLTALSSVAQHATDLCKSYVAALLSPNPTHLGYPSKVAQSTYYPGDVQITEAEIEAFLPFLIGAKLTPRNTRLGKHLDAVSGKHVFDVLKESVEKAHEKKVIGLLEPGEEARTSLGGSCN
jgi:dipeptidyl-peptidase III